MGIKNFRPTTPARRYYQVSDFKDITTDKPHKSLLAPARKHGGPVGRPQGEAAHGNGRVVG